jgi:hypothetical protein
MLSMNAYVAARIALAKAYLQDNDQRYLDAYVELRRTFLAAHAVNLMADGQSPVLPALLRPQAAV